MKRSPLRYLWSAPDIRRKLLVTIGLLTIYRLVSHVPVPGVNRQAIQQILAGGGAGGTLFSLLDLLSGGTVSNFSVLAMGVYPYITAQIILSCGADHATLQKKMKKIREGQKWMTKWTYILLSRWRLPSVSQIHFNQFTGGTPISAIGFVPDFTCRPFQSS
jgi:preprotein translocase subunit SecY